MAGNNYEAHPLGWISAGFRGITVVDIPETMTRPGLGEWCGSTWSTGWVRMNAGYIIQGGAYHRLDSPKHRAHQDTPRGVTWGLRSGEWPVGKPCSRAEAWWWNFKNFHKINHINHIKHIHVRSYLICKPHMKARILNYMQNIIEFGDPYPLGILSPVEPELFWGVYPLRIKSPGDQPQNIWNSNSQLGLSHKLHMCPASTGSSHGGLPDQFLSGC